MLFISSMRLFKSFSFTLHSLLSWLYLWLMEASLAQIDLSSVKRTPVLLTYERLTILFRSSVVRGLFSVWLLLTSSKISTVFCFSDSIVNSSNFCLVLSFKILSYYLSCSDVYFTFFVSCACSSMFLRFQAGGSCWVAWQAISSAVSIFENFQDSIRFFALNFCMLAPTAFSSQFLHVKLGFTPSPKTTFSLTFFSQRLQSLPFNVFFARYAKSPCILATYFFLFPPNKNIRVNYILRSLHLQRIQTFHIITSSQIFKLFFCGKKYVKCWLSVMMIIINCQS